MSKLKACKECKTIFEGEKCPKCQSVNSTESWKGRVTILNPEQSEVAQKMKLKEKGTFAIKNK